MLDYDYLVRAVKLVPRTLEAMPTDEAGGATYVFKLKRGIFFPTRRRRLTLDRGGERFRLDLAQCFEQQFRPSVLQQRGIGECAPPGARAARSLVEPEDMPGDRTQMHAARELRVDIGQHRRDDFRARARPRA